MEKQRWTSEGVLSYLRPLSTYTMYMKYPNNEDNRKKLSRIPNQIRFIEEAINSNDLSKDDMKILHDFYRENQESIDKVYLYSGKKNELENFKKNILESLNISEFIDEKLESFENYFNSKNLETQRFSSNCIDAYIDKNRLSVRKKEDSYELEIANREEGLIKKTEISSIKDLDFEVNTFLDKLNKKEKNANFLEDIKNFVKENDFEISNCSTEDDLLFDKKNLLFSLEKNKEGFTLTIERAIQRDFEKVNEIKINSLEDFISEISNYVDIKKEKIKDTSIET